MFVPIMLCGIAFVSLALIGLLDWFLGDWLPRRGRAHINKNFSETHTMLMRDGLTDELYETETCPTCHGRGHSSSFLGGRKACPECGWAGWIKGRTIKKGHEPLVSSTVSVLNAMTIEPAGAEHPGLFCTVSKGGT